METISRIARKRHLLFAAVLVCAVAVTLSIGAPMSFAAETDLAAGSNVKVGESALASELKANATAPKGSKVLSLTFKSGNLSIKWQKTPGVDGYQLEYTQKNYFDRKSIKKKVEFTKKRNAYNAFNTCSIVGRTALTGDVLEARIRTWKESGGKRVYSSWSATKQFITRTTWNKTFVAPKQYEEYSPAYLGADLNGKVTNLKNRNPKIAKMEGEYGYYLQVFRPGKATITFNYLGKNITLKVNAVKWTAPFALFKTGSKDVTKKANNWNGWAPNGLTDGVPYGKFSGKLNIKTANGWKVTSIVISSDKGSKKVSNGYKITRSDREIQINLKNTRTKAMTFLALVNEWEDGSNYF